MRRVLLSVVLVLVVFAGRAQQRPQYALYFQNNYVLNPAITGIEDFTDVKLSFRKQWVGINGSPVTAYLSAQGPIGDANKGHAGIGGLVVGDQTGPDNRLSVSGSFAYHVPLSGSVWAAVGISGGFTQYSLNTNALRFSFDNTTDPALSKNRPTQLIPDLSLGVWVYSTKFYVGGALNQIVPSQLNFGSGTLNPNEALKSHAFITGGIKLPISDDLNFLPSVMIKYISPAPVSFDFNGKLLFKDYLWIGASVRRGDGFSIVTGINISPLLNVGYAYDYTTSALQVVTLGSHEIILGLQLGNYNKVRCPKMSW